MRYSVIFALLCAVLCANICSAFEGYVTQDDRVSIDWGSGNLVVTAPVTIAPDGFDAMHRSARAVRQAAVNARKNMLDAIYRIQVDSSSTVGHFLQENDADDARVRSLVQNSKLIRPNFVGGEGAVSVYTSLRGKLAEAIYPPTLHFESGIAPKMKNMVDSLGTLNMLESTAPVTLAHTYTGLIVDARSLINVQPALAPCIFGRDGNAVYGPYAVSRTNAVEHGLVAYSTTIDSTLLYSRVGDNPLVVEALTTVGSTPTDFVISAGSAYLVRALMENPLIRTRCAVVIVFSTADEEPAQES